MRKIKMVALHCLRQLTKVIKKGSYVMRAIETLINVKENGEIFLHFPQELKIGYFRP